MIPKIAHNDIALADNESCEISCDWFQGILVIKTMGAFSFKCYGGVDFVSNV